MLQVKQFSIRCRLYVYCIRFTMQEDESKTIEEVKLWLNDSIRKEKLQNASVNITGQSEKGDGFIGDIVFAHISGTTSENKEKQIHYVFKCSKESNAFRRDLPIAETFAIEFAFYNEILPSFRRFQESRNVKDVFDSVPKFYGGVMKPNIDILVLENLKMKGYELYNVQEPLTDAHLEMVLNEYGKLHAISVAMQDQSPEEFERLKGYVPMDVFVKILNSGDVFGLIKKNVILCANELKGIVDEQTLNKWLTLLPRIKSIFTELRYAPGLKVFIHGDSWNNNFMHKYNKQNKSLPIKTAILDWQISYLCSPIFDLSYFLFSCMNETAAGNVSKWLDVYYKAFSNSLIEMKSDPNKLWPKTQFLEDWKMFAVHGIPLAIFIFKMAYCKKEDLPDLGANASEGKNIADSFDLKISDLHAFRKRVASILKSVVDNDLL